MLSRAVLCLSGSSAAPNLQCLSNPFARAIRRTQAQTSDACGWSSRCISGSYRYVITNAAQRCGRRGALATAAAGHGKNSCGQHRKIGPETPALRCMWHPGLGGLQSAPLKEKTLALFLLPAVLQASAQSGSRLPTYTGQRLLAWCGWDLGAERCISTTYKLHTTRRANAWHGKQQVKPKTGPCERFTSFSGACRRAARATRRSTINGPRESFDMHLVGCCLKVRTRSLPPAKMGSGGTPCWLADMILITRLLNGSPLAGIVDRGCCHETSFTSPAKPHSPRKETSGPWHSNSQK